MTEYVYQRRPSYLTVIQWQECNWEDVKKWLNKNDVSFERAGPRLTVRTLKNTGAWMNSYPGDWLVRDDSGGVWMMKSEELDAYYVNISHKTFSES